MKTSPRSRPCRSFLTTVIMLCAIVALSPRFWSGPALAADLTEPRAVAIMYHRFGESSYPSTNIGLDQFEAHLEELKTGRYQVLPLMDIVAALQRGEPLPDRAIALTVDDAYLSVYEEAWPRLKALGYPLTVFVATDPIDRSINGYMTWEQIRSLKADGVTIGSQTASHLHMAKSSEARNRGDLEKSQERFIEELGEAPSLIAYPYGEASLAVVDLVKQYGFIAGFGQHSGAIGPAESLYYLPRYSMNERYGSIDRFKMAVNSMPLPHKDFTPENPLIDAAINPPPIGFTLGETVASGTVNCFASHQEGPVRIERLGGERLEIRLDEPFPVGRSRLNCTRLGPDGRWYWLGRQFYRAQ